MISKFQRVPNFVSFLLGYSPASEFYTPTQNIHEISKQKANWIGHILRRNCLLQQATAGKIKGGDRSDRKTRKKT